MRSGVGFEQWADLLGEAIDSVAAFRACLVRTNLADALTDFDSETLFLKAGQEAADGMRRPTP